MYPAKKSWGFAGRGCESGPALVFLPIARDGRCSTRCCCQNTPKSGTDLTCGPAMASASMTIGLKQENRKKLDLKMSKV